MVTNKMLGVVVAGAMLGALMPNMARAGPAVAYTLVTLNGMYVVGEINNAGLVVGSDGSRALTWQPGGAQPLAIPALGFPDGGFRDLSVSVNVSDNGQIATTVSTEPQGRQQRALRWQNGTYTLLTNASFETRAYGINDAGLVVGRTRYPGGGLFQTIDVATTWGVNGVATELGNLGGFSSRALAVNNQGLVVGWSEAGISNSAAVRAVQWFQGVPTALVSPGAGTRDEARGISESGLIVGVSRNAAGRDLAAQWVGTSDLAFNLGTLPGFDSSWANAVNSSGQAVGSSYRFADLSSIPNRAVLWDGFVATDLNLYLSPEQIQAGWKLYDATSINDAGSILVNGVNIVSNEYQAFLLTAVPEPGTWALWLAGLAGVGSVAKRRLLAAGA